MIMPKLEGRGWYMKDKKLFQFGILESNYFQDLLGEKLESQLIVQNM